MESDKETIKAMLGESCVDVTKTTTDVDKTGIDYIATLRRGRMVTIDAKTREKGCSVFWKKKDDKKEPEAALEKWSVMPNGPRLNTPRSRAKPGWTLDEFKRSEMILFVWDPEDSKEAFLVPFQPLRMAFQRNIKVWMAVYKVPPPQHTVKRDGSEWESQCVFVPIGVIWQAVIDVSSGKRVDPPKAEVVQSKPTQLELFKEFHYPD